MLNRKLVRWWLTYTRSTRCDHHLVILPRRLLRGVGSSVHVLVAVVRHLIVAALCVVGSGECLSEVRHAVGDLPLAVDEGQVLREVVHQHATRHALILALQWVRVSLTADGWALVDDLLDGRRGRSEGGGRRGAGGGRGRATASSDEEEALVWERRQLQQWLAGGARVELLGLLRSTIQQLPPLHIHPVDGANVAILRCPLHHGLHRVALLQLLLSNGILSFDLHIQDGCRTPQRRAQTARTGEKARVRECVTTTQGAQWTLCDDPLPIVQVRPVRVARCAALTRQCVRRGRR
jgi:hypothetical protein